MTARAEILDGDPTNAVDQIDAVDHPYWTGVWQTGRERLDVGANPQRATSLGRLNPAPRDRALSAVWLISKDTASAADFEPLSWQGDSVVLARDMGVNDLDIQAPLIPFQSSQNQISGAFAYWVSDEGLKAKVDLEDPEFGSSSQSQAENQLRVWNSPANAMQMVLPVSIVSDFRETPTQELARISGAEALPLLESIDTARLDLPEIRPDMTFHSKGVLSDVRNGGLKLDLTAAFEDASGFRDFAASNGKGSSMLYRARSDAFPSLSPSVDSVSHPDGLSWFSLFDYYNLYKDVAPASSGAASGPAGVGDPNRAPLPYQLAPRGYANKLDGITLRTGSLLPETISFRVDIALSSYDSDPSPSTENWKLRLHYYPQVVLYNPYSVALSLDDFAITRWLNPWGVGASARPGISGNVGAESFDFKLNSYDEITSDYRFPMSTAAGETNLLLPGETRVYGLDQNRPIASTDFEAAIEFLDLVSNQSMSADFSQFVDVPGFTGTADGSALVEIDSFTGNAQVERTQVFSMLLSPSESYWPAPVGATERFIEGARFPNGSVSGTWTPREISTMTQPVHLRGIFVRWKGLKATGSAFSLPYQNANTSPPIFMGNSPQTAAFDQTFFTTAGETYIRTFGQIYQNGESELQIDPAPNGISWETSFGNASVGFDSPGNRRIIRDVPSQPLSSLGQFMHMSATSWAGRSSYQALDVGSMFVGGSIPNPILPGNVNAADPIPGNSSARLVLDDSFLANETLFDRYFLSTIPPKNLAGGTAWPQAWRDFNAANSGAFLEDASTPLLNTRLRVRSDRPVPMDELRNAEQAAAHLLLDGAFNVNSTSVPAWKALLASKAGNRLSVYNATTTSVENFAPTDEYPMTRFWSATGNLMPEDPWNGLRTLNENELTRLAEEIVQQVKRRGPFLSFADFLNRRLVATGEFGRTGALQAAIDQADLNDGVDAKGEPLNISAIFVERFQDNLPVVEDLLNDAKGERRTTAVGTPGYLMQQDLVQNFSGTMAVRSDTFVIRCYGESRNPISGEVSASAWGEALVQRLPDYLDPDDAPETEFRSLSQTINQTFGRRFRIVSFNWLNADQI